MPPQRERPWLAPDMTLAQTRRVLTAEFERAGLDSPGLDARLLVGQALGLDRTELATKDDQPIGANGMDTLAVLVARRLDREPVARIIGIKEFWGLPFRLSDATLVPRPETETLVEAALAAIDDGGPRRRALRITDLGTGSGALLIALLTELPGAAGIGTDVSREALATARDNAARLGVASRAHFVMSNFGAALAGAFDLVVSNPPYVASGDIDALPPEVRHDPRRALDGGTDGLDGYRTIARQAGNLLGPRGHLVVELGIGQESDVAALFRAAGLAVALARPDLSGIPRALRACVATMTP